jgi:uncharacterized protein
MTTPKFLLILASFIVIIIVVGIVNMGKGVKNTLNSMKKNIDPVKEITEEIHPLSIENLRKGTYPGSEIKIEETLESGSNYQRYLTSYQSEGNKIYALLTVPNGEKPATGWPVIVFNHGYIPPAEYRTTERYIAYTDAFSRNGYIVFRSDYRGHGNSEGKANGGYGNNDYTIDVLNAIASIKKYKGSDPNRIGMWGHSMGGYITLRSMVVNKDIKAGSLWAGVVASYPDLLTNWRRGTVTSPQPTRANGGWRQTLVQKYGNPSVNSSFWNSISANSYLKDISGPVEIQHGTEDTDVPVEFSEKLDAQLKEASKESDLYIYPGDDHNLSQNLSVALQRSVEFFDEHVKNGK